MFMVRVRVRGLGLVGLLWYYLTGHRVGAIGYTICTLI